MVSPAESHFQAQLLPALQHGKLKLHMHSLNRSVLVACWTQQLQWYFLDRNCNRLCIKNRL